MLPMSFALKNVSPTHRMQDMSANSGTPGPSVPEIGRVGEAPKIGNRIKLLDKGVEESAARS
jgi:hypothetical protein